MKLAQISAHLWSLKTWMLFPVHVWLVTADDGVTLVDSGFGFMAGGILDHISRLGAGPLTRILLTHGHSDHVGSVNAITSRMPVPVYAHRIELPYMNGELLYPRRKRLEHNIRPGLAQALAEDPNGNLAPVAGLAPYHTPGHSPGHVVYYHEQDRVLLAGDMATSRKGKLYRPMPMFTANMTEALRSTAIVRRLNPELLAVCHGEPVARPAGHLDAYLRSTASALSIPESALGL